ncbi:MAG: response regulator [Lachnospiraceae bacterium]|nr:response regulator [Lachnospiraceae bacterium]
MQNTVLVVDDMEINREILAEILGEEYQVKTAEDGRKALEMIEELHEELAVVLLDLMMPVVDGFAVLEVMQEKGWSEKIPVLIISGETSVNAERKCFDYHISDFIRKPFDNALVKKRVRNVVNLYQYQRDLEDKVQAQTKTLREQNKLLQLQADKLRKSNTNIIEILGTVVEYRDFESGEHINRVKGYTRILAERLAVEYPEYGLDQEEIEVIVSASALHDVGKIAIPDNILLKPGRLTDEEFACMKTHTTRGGEILQNIRNAWDEEYGKISYQICRHHHEKFDGRGYPDGLVGDEIPIAAQIVSIADVYDALVNERVYKDAFPKEEAFRMIMNGECGKFNPKLLECFRIERKAFEELKTTYDHMENV